MPEESWKLWLQVLKVQDSVSFCSRGSFHYYYVILAFSDVLGLKLKKFVLFMCNQSSSLQKIAFTKNIPKS